jgi:hypothetical protein
LGPQNQFSRFPVLPADSHFSLHVFAVHSAYKRAAGSALARIPKRCGGWSSLFNPAEISASRLWAMVPARTTLQEGGGSGVVAMDSVEPTNCLTGKNVINVCRKKSLWTRRENYRLRSTWLFNDY